MKVKPWQLVVIALGVIVGVGSVVYRVILSEGSGLPERTYLVNVQSGELYEVDLRRTRFGLPAVDPATGKHALLRIQKEQDGSFVVTRRDLSVMDGLDPSVKVTAIDPKTGRLITPPGVPQKFPTNQ